jgi:hypothetical protein
MNAYDSNRAEQISTSGSSSTSRTQLWLGSKRSRWIASLALVAGIVGATVGIATSSSSALHARSATRVPHLAGYGSDNGTSNARTAPAANGSGITIDAVSSTSFTLATPTGEKVTVGKAPTTTYEARGPPRQTPSAKATMSYF